MSASRSPVVCLDLGAEQVAGVQLLGARVERWFTRPLLPGTLPAGAPTNPDRLAGQLRAALGGAGITARRARMAIPDAALLTRVVILPPMPGRELRRAAAYAAERAIPIPQDKADWSWSSSRARSGGRAIRVVAGWRDVVKALQRAAELAGLTLEAVEPRSAALAGILPDTAVLVEVVGSSLQVSAWAPETSPFTGQVSLGSGGTVADAAVESLLTAARRHLGPAGREASMLTTADAVRAVPALGPSDGAANRLSRPPVVPAGFAVDGYLACLGLGQVRRRPSQSLSREPLAAMRGRVRAMPAPVVPALAAVSVVSWSAVAAGAALLLGWHPSWPLAP